MGDFRGSAPGSQQRAQQHAKERDLMRALFRDQRDALQRAASAVAVDAGRFVPASGERAARLAAGTVGLVARDAFAQIRSGLDAPDLPPQPLSADQARAQQLRLQQRAARLSFDPFEADARDPVDVPEAQETQDTTTTDNTTTLDTTETLDAQQAQVPQDTTVTLDPQDTTETQNPKDPQEPQHTPHALRPSSPQPHHTSPQTHPQPQITFPSPCRLTVSFYDGTDHRFFIDCCKSDRVSDVLARAQRHYGPLTGLLPEDLILVKDGLILPPARTLAHLAHTPHPTTARPLFAFVPRPRDQRHAPPGTAPPDRLIDTDASRTARICSRAWLARNRHRAPARHWAPLDQ